MALGDESFFDILGNEISRQMLVQLMIDYYNEAYEDDKTKITDFNEGSEIRNILESSAVDIYHLEKSNYELSKIPFIRTAYGDWLDLHGELYDLERKVGTQAWGHLKFSIPKVLSQDVTIPAGTIVMSETTASQYLTSTEMTLVAGEKSVLIPAYSYLKGREFNAEPNTLTIFFNNPPYTSMTVTNPERFSGGRDDESDKEYRERLLALKKQDTFGSISYYRNLGKNIAGVHDVSIGQDEVPEGYTAIAYINGEEKPTNEETMAEAWSVFTREDNIVLKHNFLVAEPTYNEYDLDVSIIVEALVDDEDIKRVIHAFCDGGSFEGVYFDGLRIGQRLNRFQLEMAIEEVMNVLHVESLTSDGRTFTYLPVDANGVIKIDTINVTQTVGE